MQDPQLLQQLLGGPPDLALIERLRHADLEGMEKSLATYLPASQVAALMQRIHLLLGPPTSK